MMYSTTRSNRNYVNGLQELNDDYIRRVAPSVYATQPYQAMSSKYQFIPTAHVIDAMRSHGFVPVRAAESRTRIEEKEGYVRHMVAFSLPDAPLLRSVGDTRFQVIVMNAHDGSSAYKLMAAVWRLICSNGLVVSEDGLNWRVKHSGKDIALNVVESTFELTRLLPKISESIEHWRSVKMDIEEKVILADTALSLRYDEGKHRPITPAQLLQPRRRDDVSDDLWTTYNVIQENLTQGGMTGRTKSGQHRKVRKISGLQEDTKINQALWQLTAKMAQLKGHNLVEV